MAFALEMPETLADDHSPVVGKIGPYNPDHNDEPETEASSTESADPDPDESVPEAKTDNITEVPQPDALPVAAASLPEDDDRYFEHLDLMARMAECERERRAAWNEWQELKEDTKEAKQKYEVKVVQLQGIAAEIEDLMGDSPSPKKSADQTADQPAGDSSTDAVDNSWRNINTADLLQGMDGLGAKKLESIVAAYPTVGDLEDARGNASQSHKSFKEVLPKGCGQKIADSIEDRLIDHVAKYSTPPASQQVKENQQATGSDDGASAEHSEESLETIDSMLKDIREQAEKENWDEETCDYTVGIETASEYSVAGFNAFNDGALYTEVPADLRQSYQESWLVGWVSAERLKRLRGTTPAAAADDDLGSL